MECLTQVPQGGIVDQRPRKRQRLRWDVLPDNLTLIKLLSDDVTRCAIWYGTSEYYHVRIRTKIIGVQNLTRVIAINVGPFVELFGSVKFGTIPDPVGPGRVRFLIWVKAQLGLFSAQEAGVVPELKSDKELVRVSSPPLREDDKNGHYVFAVGDNLTSRYKIHSKMGEGTFGQVLECWDRESKEMVAIKIICGIKKFMDDARIEIDILQQLGKYEEARSRFVQVRDWFEYRNHICIVFEKLGPSWFDFLRENNYCGFPIDLVREFARQLLESLEFMHELRLIHTDLKPENILVSPEYIKVPDYKVTSKSPKEGSYYKCLPKSSSIKVIDFGGTTVDSKKNTFVVSTRNYRAPEVILGLGWGYACDIWSVGCIIVELFSGDVLFQTLENLEYLEDLEHLAMMEKVLGPLPGHMLRKTERHAEKFVRRGRLNWPEGCVSVKSMEAVLKVPRLKNIVRENVDHSAGDLIDLLHGLLRYDPSDRLFSAQEALCHPFFTRGDDRRS